MENTAHVPSPEEEESIFMEIPKPKAKKTVNLDPNSPNPNLYQSKLPYPERMKVRENDKPSAQHIRFLKMFKQLRLEIGLKDTLVKMPKFNKWLNSLLRNKEKLEEIVITTVNAECSAIIMNKLPEKLEDPRKFLIPCALQELNRTSALADSGASINLLPHSIYKKLELEALTPTRMTLELANRSITHPMGIAEDVVVRVDGFTFLADFVVVNFEPDPRVPIILGRPFLRTAKALIDLYEETLTLRVGKDELVYYADKSEKNKNKHCAHAISVIDFSKDDPFSGSTTTHSDDPSPSSSPVKTSDNFEKFADELAPLDSLPPGNDDSTLKKDLHEENFQEDVEIKNSNVSDKLVFLNTPLSDKDECFAPEDDNDEINDFLAMEVSSNLEEGYFDSEGDIAFLDNLLSDDDSHNLASEVTSDHEPEQNVSSITFSPRSDPLHHEFAGEPLTLPARNDQVEEIKEKEDEVSNDVPIHTIVMPIRTTFDNPIDHFSKPKYFTKDFTVSLDSTESNILPPPLLDSDSPFTAELSASVTLNSFENEDKVFKPGILVYHVIHDKNLVTLEENLKENISSGTLLIFKEPSFLLTPPRPPDDFLNFEPILVMKNVVLNEDFYQSNIIIWTFLPHFTYTEESPLIFSFRSANFVFDPGIITFHHPVAFSIEVSCSKIDLTNSLKSLVSGVVSRSTRASHPLCEISLGRSDILSSLSIHRKYYEITRLTREGGSGDAVAKYLGLGQLHQLRRRPIFDRFNLGRDNVNTLIVNHVTEELYPGDPEFTFGELGVQFFLLKQFQDLPNAFFMFLLTFGVDQNVIDEDNYKLVQIRFTHPVYKVHEHGRCISQTKRHNLKDIVTVSSLECSLGNVFFSNSQLVIP
ncbi:reverse transcriptase domain-containing protein [Tanacetum coccineum]